MRNVTFKRINGTVVWTALLKDLRASLFSFGDGGDAFITTYRTAHFIVKGGKSFQGWDAFKEGYLMRCGEDHAHSVLVVRRTQRRIKEESAQRGGVTREHLEQESPSPTRADGNAVDCALLVKSWLPSFHALSQVLWPSSNSPDYSPPPSAWVTSVMAANPFLRRLAVYVAGDAESLAHWLQCISDCCHGEGGGVPACRELPFASASSHPPEAHRCRFFTNVVEKYSSSFVAVLNNFRSYSQAGSASPRRSTTAPRAVCDFMRDSSLCGKPEITAVPDGICEDDAALHNCPQNVEAERDAQHNTYGILQRSSHSAADLNSSGESFLRRVDQEWDAKAHSPSESEEDSAIVGIGDGEVTIDELEHRTQAHAEGSFGVGKKMMTSYAGFSPYRHDDIADRFFLKAHGSNVLSWRNWIAEGSLQTEADQESDRVAQRSAYAAPVSWKQFVRTCFGFSEEETNDQTICGENISTGDAESLRRCGSDSGESLHAYIRYLLRYVEGHYCPKNGRTAREGEGVFIVEYPSVLHAPEHVDAVCSSFLIAKGLHFGLDAILSSAMGVSPTCPFLLQRNHLMIGGAVQCRTTFNNGLLSTLIAFVVTCQTWFANAYAKLSPAAMSLFETDGVSDLDDRFCISSSDAAWGVFCSAEVYRWIRRSEITLKALLFQREEADFIGTFAAERASLQSVATIRSHLLASMRGAHVDEGRASSPSPAAVSVVIRYAPILGWRQTSSPATPRCYGIAIHAETSGACLAVLSHAQTQLLLDASSSSNVSSSSALSFSPPSPLTYFETELKRSQMQQRMHGVQLIRFIRDRQPRAAVSASLGALGSVRAGMNRVGRSAQPSPALNHPLHSNMPLASTADCLTLWSSTMQQYFKALIEPLVFAFEENDSMKDPLNTEEFLIRRGRSRRRLLSIDATVGFVIGDALDYIPLLPITDAQVSSFSVSCVGETREGVSVLYPPEASQLGVSVVPRYLPFAAFEDPSTAVPLFARCASFQSTSVAKMLRSMQCPPPSFAMKSEGRLPSTQGAGHGTEVLSHRKPMLEIYNDGGVESEDVAAWMASEVQQALQAKEVRGHATAASADNDAVDRPVTMIHADKSWARWYAPRTSSKHATRASCHGDRNEHHYSVGIDESRDGGDRSCKTMTCCAQSREHSPHRDRYGPSSVTTSATQFSFESRGEGVTGNKGDAREVQSIPAVRCSTPPRKLGLPDDNANEGRDAFASSTEGGPRFSPSTPISSSVSRGKHAPHRGRSKMSPSCSVASNDVFASQPQSHLQPILGSSSSVTSLSAMRQPRPFAATASSHLPLSVVGGRDLTPRSPSLTPARLRGKRHPSSLELLVTTQYDARLIAAEQSLEGAVGATAVPCLNHDSALQHGSDAVIHGSMIGLDMAAAVEIPLSARAVITRVVRTGGEGDDGGRGLWKSPNDEDEASHHFNNDASGDAIINRTLFGAFYAFVVGEGAANVSPHSVCMPLSLASALRRAMLCAQAHNPHQPWAWSSYALLHYGGILGGVHEAKGNSSPSLLASPASRCAHASPQTLASPSLKGRGVVGVAGRHSDEVGAAPVMERLLRSLLVHRPNTEDGVIDRMLLELETLHKEEERDGGSQTVARSAASVETSGNNNGDADYVQIPADAES